MHANSFFYFSCRLVPFMVLISCMTAWAEDVAELPVAGTKLPAFVLDAPEAAEDRAYLGVTESTITLQDIQADLILMEIVGVYCPVCHQQAPNFNRLAARLKRSPATVDRVRMMAFAVGATPMEIVHLKETLRISYPILFESGFDIHKKLAEPLTPFTMLLRPDGEVLYTHLGLVEDIDALYALILKYLP